MFENSRVRNLSFQLFFRFTPQKKICEAIFDHRVIECKVLLVTCLNDNGKNMSRDDRLEMTLTISRFLYVIFFGCGAA